MFQIGDLLRAQLEFHAADDLGVRSFSALTSGPFARNGIRLRLKRVEFVQCPKQGCLPGFVFPHQDCQIAHFDPAGIQNALVHLHSKTLQLHRLKVLIFYSLHRRIFVEGHEESILRGFSPSKIDQFVEFLKGNEIQG